MTEKSMKTLAKEDRARKRQAELERLLREGKGEQVDFCFVTIVCVVSFIRDAMSKLEVKMFPLVSGKFC